MKEYIMPHNYKDNGRIFNMFDKKALAKALMWLVPIIALVFGVLPISLSNKFFFAVLFGTPGAMFFLLGLDGMLMDMLNFSSKRKVYYDTKKGEKYELAYEKNKRNKEEASKSTGSK